jgi:hypothetical protein
MTLSFESTRSLQTGLNGREVTGGERPNWAGRSAAASLLPPGEPKSGGELGCFELSALFQWP